MKAKNLLTDASRWTQGADARDAWGRACDPDSPAAAMYCLRGAVLRAYGESEAAEAALERVKRAVGAKGPLGIEYWNDNLSRTFAEVLEVLEKSDV
jgi:hypothetical protein